MHASQTRHPDPDGAPSDDNGTVTLNLIRSLWKENSTVVPYCVLGEIGTPSGHICMDSLMVSATSYHLGRYIVNDSFRLPPNISTRFHPQTLYQVPAGWQQVEGGVGSTIRSFNLGRLSVTE